MQIQSNLKMLKNNQKLFKPCVIGLGYVGLPILLNLANKYPTHGYDINVKRINNLKKGIDTFNEYKKKHLKKKKLKYLSKLTNFNKCNFFIITVPTPIYKNKKPDLTHLRDVCKNLSKILKKDDIIIFESTVYPGITKKYCIPILENQSKLKEGKDFYVGYSPERVNPGDKKHKLKNINKILAYPHKFKIKEILKIYSNLGKKIILTKKIEEAETAKVIENIQRDVNIGLINEIYLICKKMKINFEDVMKLASTKWNFIKFKPGLVGGHCLPVDPYYFAYISKKNSAMSKITLAGRSTNDSMQDYIYKKIVNCIKLNKYKKILICGLTYKENVSDLRNSLAYAIFKKLKKNNLNIFGYDPLIDHNIARKNRILIKEPKLQKFDIYIVLTNHDRIRNHLKKIKRNKIFFPL